MQRLSSFRARVAAIVVGAVTLRVLYVLVLAREVTAAGDSTFFHATANQIADGYGLVEPFLLGRGIDVPSAAHPPLYPIVLSLSSLLGGTSTHAHRVFGALLGGVTIVLIALIARRVAGDRAGVLAAAIAAVYPVLVVTDGALMSEGLYSLLFAATLLTALVLWERRDLRLGALLGVLIGLAALTRSEALALLPLLAWPLALAFEGAKAAAGARGGVERGVRARDRAVGDPQHRRLRPPDADLAQRQHGAGGRQLPRGLPRAGHRPVALRLHLRARVARRERSGGDLAARGASTTSATTSEGSRW